MRKSIRLRRYEDKKGELRRIENHIHFVDAGN